MNYSICKVKLNQPLKMDTENCGGDCLECMARAGDPDAIDSFIKRMKRLTLELKSFVVLWEELDGEKSAGVYLDSRRFREARNTLEGK